MLCLSYRQIRGAWSVSLGAAAARLDDGRTLLVEQRADGYTWMTSPARMEDISTHGRCPASCGA